MKASSCCFVETVPDRWWAKPAAQVGSILYLGFRVFWLKILGSGFGGYNCPHQRVRSYRHFEYIAYKENII